MREQIIGRPSPAVLLAMVGAVRGTMACGRTVTPASAAVTAAVVGGSLCLLAGSVGNLLRHRITIDPVRVEWVQHFVVDGPNRLTRNPMCLGLTGLLLSHVVARRSPSALILLAGFVWLIDRHQIPTEERALEERSGQDYLDYKEIVPHWLNVPDLSPGDRSREPKAHCQRGETLRR